MDTEDGEFVICGSGGSAEDAAVDAVVGIIEDFMISFDPKEVWQSVPPLHTVFGDHDQHTIYRSFLERVEKELDVHVLAACPDYKSIEEVCMLLQKHREDITEEVWEFLTEGCFDYEAFIEQWKHVRP